MRQLVRLSRTSLSRELLVAFVVLAIVACGTGTGSESPGANSAAVK
jgi:hypothetical protein